MIFIITFIATLIGSIFGIGGGVIIKPTLEAFTNYSLSQINALSGITVLAMASVSTYKYLKSGLKINKELILLSVGASIGGFLGKELFDYLILNVDQISAKTFQYLMIIFVLLVVLYKNKFRSHNVKNNIVLMLSGLIMGTISAFLGIGGGPLNILILYILFSINSKKSALYSVFVIFFSQLTLTILSIFSMSYSGLNLEPLMYMIPAAIVGGIIGPVFHKVWNMKVFERNFSLLMIGLAILNIYNIVKLY
jgi:uncharacterized membrane protein YfcA